MKTILNRDFKHPEDGWYHIEPQGEHPNSNADVSLVLDDEACKKICNSFNVAAFKGELSHGNEILIDIEHFSHDTSKETRAFGWLQQLQNRGDGIYGKIRWTSTGKAAVDGGDYRFFSTEYDPKDCQVLNSEKKQVRPVKLAGLTLTNRPNNRGGKPITNSGGGEDTQATAKGNGGGGQDAQGKARSETTTETARAAMIRTRALKLMQSQKSLSIASAWIEAARQIDGELKAVVNDTQKTADEITNRARQIMNRNPGAPIHWAFRRAMEQQ